MTYGTPGQAMRGLDRRLPTMRGIDPLKARRQDQEIEDVRAGLEGLASEQFVQESVAHLARADATAQAISGVMAAMPRPATFTPRPETTAGAAGADMSEFSPGLHQHPRLTSATGPHTLDATGRASIIFTRTFDKPPVLTLQRVTDAATKERPVDFQVTYARSGALYVGAAVIGQRSQLLPALSPLSGITLLTQLVTGVNGIVSALTGFDVFGASASGVKFTCLAVQSSE